MRPLRSGDAVAWLAVRQRNVDWLGPWEATPPGGGAPVAASRPVFAAMRRSMNRQARLGEALPFAVTYEGRLVGQLTVAGITRGSLNSGFAGYWVDQSVAGRGVIPTSLALAVDHCFAEVGLHRIEVNVRPENLASRRVVEKLGFREEGMRERYLHIDGGYRDHLVYALTTEDVPGGLLAHWRAARRG